MAVSIIKSTWYKTCRDSFKDCREADHDVVHAKMGHSLNDFNSAQCL